LSRSVDFLGLAKMNLVGCHEADPSVMMILIIPCKEPAAERAGGTLVRSNPQLATCWPRLAQPGNRNQRL